MRIIALGAVALLSSVAIAQQNAAPAGDANGAHHGPVSKAKKLTNAEFDAYLEHPEQVLLIDVRRPDEVSNIGGFPVYLSIQAKDLKNHLSEIPKDRAIITVSNHAARAGAAADLLADNGFKVLGAVGADTYQNDGGKLAVKIPVPKSPEGGKPATAGGSNAAPATTASSATQGSN
jgi:rhodanese-related sulfurtransferase